MLQVDIGLLVALIAVVVIFTFLGRAVYAFVTGPLSGPSLLTFLTAQVGPRTEEDTRHALDELGGILFRAVVTYGTVLVTYLFSGTLGMVFVHILTRTPTSLDVAGMEGLAYGSMLVGALAAVLIRAFALHIWTGPIKAFYFQFILNMGGFALGSWYGNVGQLFNLAFTKSGEFMFNSFFPVFFSLCIAVAATEGLVLLPRSKRISYDLFRDRADSIEELDQVILQSDVRDIVERELEKEDQGKAITQIRWLSASGYDQIAHWLLARKCRIQIKIITTTDVADRWFAPGSPLVGLRDSVVTVDPESISNCRCLIIDKRCALRGIPMGSRYATMAGRVRDPMRVHPLVNTFDSLYDSLRLQQEASKPDRSKTPAP